MRLILRPVTRILPDTRLSVLLIDHPEGALPLCVTLDTGITPPGHYKLVRGTHSLDGVNKFTAFEVVSVRGHSGILLHPGNTRVDTKNCFLLGRRFGQINGAPAVMESRIAFDSFMVALADSDNIPFVVESEMWDYWKTWAH